jgi:hypothetical protein
MTDAAWKGFAAAREHYRLKIEELRKSSSGLKKAQQKIVRGRDGPAYVVETPIVYNGALDEIDKDSEIKLILVADNPGRREQAAENRRYLVGPSGKIAENFFRENIKFGIDFRKNILILNKTPVHTPRTAELKELCRIGGARLTKMIAQSQRYMAELLLEFHRALSRDKKTASRVKDASPGVWIIGYSEMKKRGIFETYTEALKDLYAKERPLRENIFLFRHFSMNQFTIDLHKRERPDEDITDALKRIGAAYRERILLW